MRGRNRKQAVMGSLLSLTAQKEKKFLVLLGVVTELLQGIPVVNECIFAFKGVYALQTFVKI